MLALVLTVASVVFFTNLGGGQLWDRDEPRNAGCAAEMLQRNDWVTPIFNDELRPQKPVLLYWLMMSAYQVFGQNEFAARFWSAILAVGTVGMTFLIGSRLFNPRTAMIGAICLSTSFMFVVAARAATPDSVLIFCFTLAITIWVYTTFQSAVDPESGEYQLKPKIPNQWFPRSYGAAFAIYGAMSIGVLAKGPVAIVLPTAIIGMFLLIMRLAPLPQSTIDGPIINYARRLLRPFYPIHFLKTCWYMRPGIAILTLALIAAPWYIWVGVRTDGDWLRMFFLNEHWGRATTSFESHSGEWWYYIVAILAGFFPWSIFVVPVSIFVDRQFSQKKQTSPAIVFLTCWVLVQVIVFTIAETKLPSYVTPCYPALALLTGFYLDRLACGAYRQIKFWDLASPLVLVLIGLIMVVGLAIVGNHYANGMWAIGLVGLVPVAVGAISLWFVTRQKYMHSTVTTATGAVLLCVVLFGFASVAVNQTQQTANIIEPIRTSPGDVAVATYGCLESSWIYYAKRPIYEIDNGADGDSIASLQRENQWEVKPRVDLKSFVRIKPGALIVTTDEFLPEVKTTLGGGYQVIAKSEYFLKDNNLYLLGPTPAKSKVADVYDRGQLK